MSNPNNVEQFNSQVKQMSGRLRGGSASPADAQGNDGNLDEGSNTPGAGTPNTTTAASPSSQQPSRKKNTGGKKGATVSRQGAPGGPESVNTGTTTAPLTTGTQSTSTADTQENGVSSQPRREGEGMTEPTDLQPDMSREASATRQSRSQPETTQSTAHTDSAGDLKGRGDTAHLSRGGEETPRNLIAPEVIGRAPTGGETRKPLSQ